MSGIGVYSSSFSQMDINKHFLRIGYISFKTYWPQGVKIIITLSVLFISCKICNYATKIWDIHTPVEKFGPVLFFLIKEINTFIQEGYIKLDCKYIDNVTNDFYF